MQLLRSCLIRTIISSIPLRIHSHEKASLAKRWAATSLAGNSRTNLVILSAVGRTLESESVTEAVEKCADVSNHLILLQGLCEKRFSSRLPSRSLELGAKRADVVLI